MRLTKAVIQQLLDQNQGFKHTTHHSARNFTESRTYEIINGALEIHSRGKTSWADSRFDNTGIANIEQTRRFLRSVLGLLNTNGLD